MKPIKVPTTKEEMIAVGLELDAAHFFANCLDDAEGVERANKRIEECEKAIDAASFYLDEDGNVIPNPDSTGNLLLREDGYPNSSTAHAHAKGDGDA